MQTIHYLHLRRQNIRGEPGKDYPIFSTNILCKINPTNPGCGGGAGGANGAGAVDADAREARKNRQNRQNGNRRKGGRRGNRNGRTNPQQGGNNSNFQDEIANGRVPG